jgi:hypothetical protein
VSFAQRQGFAPFGSQFHFLKSLTATIRIGRILHVCVRTRSMGEHGAQGANGDRDQLVRGRQRTLHFVFRIFRRDSKLRDVRD